MGRTLRTALPTVKILNKLNIKFCSDYFCYALQFSILQRIGQRDSDVYLPSTLVRADIVSLTRPKPAEFMMDTRK